LFCKVLDLQRSSNYADIHAVLPQMCHTRKLDLVL
jgi:hypothetical protein